MKQLLEDFSYKEDRSDVAAGVSTKTLDYLQIAVENHQWKILDEREQTLVRRYFTEDISLADLRLTANVTTPEAVRYIIIKSLERTYKRMPALIKQQYPIEELKKLKDKKAVSNSDKSIAKKKQVTLNQWKHHREELVESMKDKWKERKSTQSHTHRAQ